jgi:hypothetical protein
MRRASYRVVLLVCGALAVWGALLVVSSANYVTVVSVERHMNVNQDDLKSRDCYITAITKDKRRVSGYAPSSFCSSVKAGDMVVIKDGYVTQK